jgi:hypothetical protein
MNGGWEEEDDEEEEEEEEEEIRFLPWSPRKRGRRLGSRFLYSEGQGREAHGHCWLGR